MEILLCAKAPRADIYSQFVSALRTTAGASSADRVGRDPCVPPRSTHCSRRGTRAPPYRVRRSYGADRVVRPYTFCAGRRGRRPLRSRKECAEWDVGDAVPYEIATGALQKRADRCPPFTFLLYMTALSATMRCKNTAPACPAPHGHR